MAVLEFACPYCSGQFEIADPPAGQAVTCPHCGAGVALPEDLPLAAQNETPQAVQPSAPIEFVAPQAAPFIPLDIVTSPTTPSSRRGVRSGRRDLARDGRQLSREAREHRRLRRIAALLAVGLLVLMVALVVLIPILNDDSQR